MGEGWGQRGARPRRWKVYMGKHKVLGRERSRKTAGEREGQREGASEGRHGAYVSTRPPLKPTAPPYVYVVKFWLPRGTGAQTRVVLPTDGSIWGEKGVCVGGGSGGGGAEGFVCIGWGWGMLGQGVGKMLFNVLRRDAPSRRLLCRCRWFLGVCA